jgi:hypothetical protein
MTENSVTPLETARLASLGSLVTLPGFGNDDTFTVRLRKPNMLTLMKSGRLPNELLTAVTEMFQDMKNGKTFSSKEMAELCELMTIFCEASLVEPTYKELTDAGIELTQQQMTCIFNYTQVGRGQGVELSSKA